MSALPPKADISRACWDVRFVPKADIGSYSISWGLQLAKTAATMPLPVNYRGLEAEYCLQMLPAKNPRNSAGRTAKRGHWTQGRSVSVRRAYHQHPVYPPAAARSVLSAPLSAKRAAKSPSAHRRARYKRHAAPRSLLQRIRWQASMIVSVAALTSFGPDRARHPLVVHPFCGAIISIGCRSTRAIFATFAPFFRQDLADS